jgi:hypothetical protein
MYHPELYPELAKNNMKVQPLRLPNRTPKKLKVKVPLDQEITVLKANESFHSLANAIADCAVRSRNQDPNSFTSEYQVKPLLDDIAEIGRKFFAPEDLERKDLEFKKELFELKKSLGDDTEDMDMQIVRSDPADDKLDLRRLNNPIDLYRKRLSWDASRLTPTLRDIVREMQDNGTLNKSHDLRELPFDIRDKKNLSSANNNSLVERRKQLIDNLKDKLPVQEERVIRSELKAIDGFIQKLKDRLIKFEKREKCNLFKWEKKKYTPSTKTKARAKRIQKTIKLGSNK